MNRIQYRGAVYRFADAAEDFDAELRSRKPEGVQLDFRPDLYKSDLVWIETIRVKEPGKGHGRKVMQTIADLADQHRVTLKLRVEPFGSDRLSMKKTLDFYKRYGFKGTRKLMTRRPLK